MSQQRWKIKNKIKDWFQLGGLNNKNVPSSVLVYDKPRKQRVPDHVSNNIGTLAKNEPVHVLTGLHNRRVPSIVINVPVLNLQHQDQLFNFCW
jgi:hypothetical protein